MWILIHGEEYDLDAIGTASPAGLGISESHALRFLQAWQQGQQEFTFQTSGSTGPPRSVSFHRNQLEASARLTIHALNLRPGQHALICLDTRFVAGALMLVRGLLAGMNLIIREPSADPLENFPGPVDFMAVVPLQLATLLRHSREALDRVSVVIVGGAPLPDETVMELVGMRPAFYATYGMTETLTHIALRRLNGIDPQPRFQPLPGVNLSLDARGCLVIHAPHLGLTPIVTNDLVRFESDGFTIIGRYDDVINTGGVKVHPAAVEVSVEHTLRALGLRCRFFVTALPDDRLQEAVCLVIEGSPLPGEVEEKLRTDLSTRLGRFEMPRTILYTPRFAESATQKIDKRASLASAQK